MKVMFNPAKVFDTTVAADFFNVFCDSTPLGFGAGRTVYRCGVNPDWVVKIENVHQSFQNVMEWNNWHDLRGRKNFSKWLAPCHFISGCGCVLIQSYASDISSRELPAKLPHFLGDVKPENFGMLDGQIVCRDYAIIKVSWDAKHEKHDWRE